jgi:hypothetical protein
MPVKKGKVLDFSLEEGVSLSAMKMVNVVSMMMKLLF